MTQTAIPYIHLRGGSSKGPYFKREDLPKDQDLLAQVLVSVVGAGHALNIDGIGGGAPTTTKVAMLSKSDHEWADIDYFFAQVSVSEKSVDFRPSCGNILVGVGPAAIEMGLVDALEDITEVKIRAVNTQTLVRATVRTSQKQVRYHGNATVDGVPGTASPIELNFTNIEGSLTSSLFPSGQRKEIINETEVSIVDAAMPMVIARAKDMGMTGYETPAELNVNSEFMARLEAIRVIAGERMGLGDVSKSVVPKFGIISPAKFGGSAHVRYFMPHKCHPSLAVTGSQCLSACLLAPGTVGEGMLSKNTVEDGRQPTIMKLEHPAGVLNVLVDHENINDQFHIKSAGLVRTARKLAAGEVYVPASLWDGETR